MIISKILENVCSVESIQFAHIFNKQNDFMVVPFTVCTKCFEYLIQKHISAIKRSQIRVEWLVSAYFFIIITIIILVKPRKQFFCKINYEEFYAINKHRPYWLGYPGRFPILKCTSIEYFQCKCLIIKKVILKLVYACSGSQLKSKCNVKALNRRWHNAHISFSLLLIVCMFLCRWSQRKRHKSGFNGI